MTRNTHLRVQKVTRAAGESELSTGTLSQPVLIVSFAALSGGTADVEQGGFMLMVFHAGPYMKYLVKLKWSIESTVSVCPH